MFTFGYIGFTAGTSPDCCSFLHFLTVLGSFLTTGYLFRDLLLGSVFPHIITIICINKKINGICITMKKLSHSLTFRKMLKLMLNITIKPVQYILFLLITSYTITVVTFSLSLYADNLISLFFESKYRCVTVMTFHY